MVTVGNARFTVLTPQLIRMEWSADGKFEDHASFVFINRKLPVPKFEVTLTGESDQPASTYRHGLTIKTAALTLQYSPLAATENGRLRATSPPSNLSITFTLDGKQVVWHPGDSDPENLQGTTRTLDTARGSKTEEPIGQGLVSRSGWALSTTRRGPCSTPQTFAFSMAKKANGRG